jgi:hypothetical protein
MEKKITKADRFNQLKAIPEVAKNAELVAFIDHELDLLAKKAENKKPAKQTEEFLALKETVASVLDDTPRTISDIIKMSEELSGMSTQKLVPVIKALVTDEVAERVEEKGRAYFIAK